MKEKKTTDEYLSEMGYSLFDEFGRVLKLAAIPPGGLVFDAATGSGRMRHGKGHNIHGSISCEVIRAFIKERLFHFEEIELPLNWAYVASGKM